MSIPFVEGWSIVETLGEGAFGEVHLLINENTSSAVAMKTIDLERFPNALAAVKKEVAIHCRLSHSNIIKYYGHRQHNTSFFIFLEYASGGELFDRIDPDIGMPQADARKFFKQLIDGVEYLHNNGVAHRDLKPENIILDEDGNLKISDFGLATMFLCDRKRRKLEKFCGTYPYLAPEVLLQLPYEPEPSDIWSCGVILVAMLAGELPWDVPSNEDKSYISWKTNDYAHLSPWCKLDTLALALVRKILIPTPSRRYDISQIRSHKWLKKTKESGNKDVSVSVWSNGDLDDTRISISQPAPTVMSKCEFDFQMHSFSQPTQVEEMLISSQLLTSLPISTTPNNCVQKLVKRMTRFIVCLLLNSAISQLSEHLDSLGYTWKMNSPSLVTIMTTDQRLVFKCNVVSMNTQTLMDFRLSRGCGLEFKRHFLVIKNEMSQIIFKGPEI